MAPFNTLSLAQLREEANRNPPSYLIDGLLATGSINLLVGKPKAGKSIFARQLAAAVAKGSDFLDRTTIKGEVLYLGLDEPIASFIAGHFDLLEVEDSAIHTVFGSIPDKRISVDCLKETLDQHPDVKLVVIDTMFKFLSVDDADRYVELNNALEDLAHLAADRRITFLFVHHAKKRGGEDLGDGVLGSTAITAAMATVMMMQGSGTQQRTIRTVQRYGSQLEETTLHFAPETQTFKIGEPVSVLQAQEAESKTRNKDQQIVQYLLSHPEGVEWAKIREEVGGNTATLTAKLKEMARLNVIRCEGSGKRGDPLRYFPADAIPTEPSPIAVAA